MRFVPLPDADPAEIFAHMRDPRIRRHLPLLSGEWTPQANRRFMESKRRRWMEDGLGHWAIHVNDTYAGWGGFEREGGVWDYGLVLKPDFYGLGRRITREALAFARSRPDMTVVTFLLAPSRRSLRAMERLGARADGETMHAGTRFIRFRLDLA
ncbi:MAG: GNAT family N-acetyltransferase [Brucellaceae bacterium]|nr:GNAT family N-acetyltransferase [Notoacmeibacter sp.]MCC0027510.1 GNAT family N-acetyltransferase [Brucellaceae bacterium]